MQQHPSPPEPSPALRDVVATALGRAMDEVSTTGGPLSLQSLHRSESGIDIVRYNGRSFQDAVAEAREALIASPDPLWALVWDGYLMIDGWRTDALYTHAEQQGHETAHLFAWRYGLDENGGIGPLGASLYLGPDGRYDSPERSHPLPAGEGVDAPHGQVVPRRARWWRRRR